MKNNEEWPTQEQMAMAILILEAENKDFRKENRDLRRLVEGLRRLVKIEENLTEKEIHLKMAEFKATRQFVSSN